MLIKKIILKDYKQYIGTHNFTFDKITLLKGANGSGKTNLGVDSILFCLFGYSVTNLEGIPTQGKTQCSVEIELEHKGKIYNIIRFVPTNITILENGKEVQLVNNAVKQVYLERLLGSTDHFRRFRLLTNSRKYNKTQETNFLEEGKTTLNKILLSLNPINFNGIRQRLLAKKQEREIYNVLKLPNLGHFPSEKRLCKLQGAIKSIEGTYEHTKLQFVELRSDYEGFAREKGGLDTELEQATKQLTKLQTLDTCYACNQKLPEAPRKEAIKTKELEIEEIKAYLTQINTNYLALKVEVDAIQPKYDQIKARLDKLNRLATQIKTSVDAKSKQTKFIYTDKNVLVIKTAIDELDKFYSYYLKCNVETLAPIINSVLEKLGLKIEFTIDAKGNFDILLHKGQEVFGYDYMSDGQRLIINVAFKLALLLERGETGLIIADEGFSSLTNENLQHIFSLFSNMPFQLICVLHRFDEVASGIKVIDVTNKEEVNESNTNNNIKLQEVVPNTSETSSTATTVKRRGRPKKTGTVNI